MWQTTFSPTPAGYFGNEKGLPRFGWLKATYSDEALSWEYEAQFDCDDQEAVDAFTKTVSERFAKYIAELVVRAAEPVENRMPKFIATMDEVLTQKTAEMLSGSGYTSLALVNRG